MNLWFLLSVVGSEVVGTLAGFGSSTVLLPISLFFFDFHTALAVVAWVHVIGNVAKLGWFRGGWDRELFLKFGVASVLGSLLGASSTGLVDAQVLKKVLGGFLIVYAIGFFLRLGIKVKNKSVVLTGGGFISGMLAGLIGTGGALRGAALSVAGLRKDKYIATMAATAVMTDLTRIYVYFRLDFGNAQVGQLPFLVILAVIGTGIGKLMVGKISEEGFKKMVFAALGVVGVNFLFF